MTEQIKDIASTFVLIDISLEHHMQIYLVLIIFPGN